jgi:hypothetical protein
MHITFKVEKSNIKMWSTYVIFMKQPKVNSLPMGENSPNQVTLFLTFKLKPIKYEKNWWTANN